MRSPSVQKTPILKQVARTDFAASSAPAVPGRLLRFETRVRRSATALRDDEAEVTDCDDPPRPASGPARRRLDRPQRPQTAPHRRRRPRHELRSRTPRIPSIPTAFGCSGTSQPQPANRDARRRRCCRTAGPLRRDAVRRTAVAWKLGLLPWCLLLVWALHAPAAPLRRRRGAAVDGDDGAGGRRCCPASTSCSTCRRWPSR